MSTASLPLPSSPLCRPQIVDVEVECIERSTDPPVQRDDEGSTGQKEERERENDDGEMNGQMKDDTGKKEKKTSHQHQYRQTMEV